MKRIIIFITLVMVLVCVNAAFADNVGGIRGSKWGVTPVDVVHQETTEEGGTFSQKGMNGKGLFEVQFDITTMMGPGMSFYVFDKNNRLINGGIIITMDEEDWSIYYKNYQNVKNNLGDELKSKPKHDTCAEIFAVDGLIISCQMRKNFMGEQIAFKKIELQNIFNTDDSQVIINLIGESNLRASMVIIFKAI